MIAVDTILQAKNLIPIMPQNVVLQDHSLVIKAGKIIDLLPISKTFAKYSANEVIAYKHHILLPGFINAYTKDLNLNEATGKLLLSYGITCFAGTYTQSASIGPKLVIIDAAISKNVVCPTASCRAGLAMCNLELLKKSKTIFAIGTDNGVPDLLVEARNAALINKVLNLQPELSPAFEVMEMITLNAAKLLGMEALIGSLEIGKIADIIVWDFQTLNSYPQHNAPAQIIFAGNSQQIVDVWLSGKKVRR